MIFERRSYTLRPGKLQAFREAQPVSHIVKSGVG